MVTKKKQKWIQQAQPKPGALHKQLRYSQGDTLPMGLLKEIRDTKIGNKARGYTVTPLLKRRVNFALNTRRPRR